MAFYGAISGGGTQRFGTGSVLGAYFLKMFRKRSGNKRKTPSRTISGRRF